MLDSRDLRKIIEDGYYKPTNKKMLNENQKNTLKNVRKKNENALFFITKESTKVLLKTFQMSVVKTNM